jgi:hypothetical protein
MPKPTKHRQSAPANLRAKGKAATTPKRFATLTQTAAGNTAIKIPISNVYGGGDYTAPIYIGSKKAVANVILDTGSSTLAVTQSAYQAAADTNLQPTSLAQDILYGTGGWAGPVINTTLNFGAQTQKVTLTNAPIAVADLQEPNNFGAADGILGLAYNSLNTAYSAQSYLSRRNVNPPVTYPWPFPTGVSKTGVTQLLRLFEALPSAPIPAYFTQLAQNGVVANKFAFYTRRSMVHVTKAEETMADAVADPLNQGWFILGGGEEQTDLFTGAFVSVNVVADDYYNTVLKSVQVHGSASVAVKPLESQYQKFMFSNSIVDSGTNSLALANDVYEAIIKGITKVAAKFGKLVKASEVPEKDIDISKWPPITFTLEGADGSDVALTIEPGTYWQFGAPAPGKASFAIETLGATAPSQSILGLPLLNNYYTVFDRSTTAFGAVSFAKIA